MPACTEKKHQQGVNGGNVQAENLAHGDELWLRKFSSHRLGHHPHYYIISGGRAGSISHESQLFPGEHPRTFPQFIINNCGGIMWESHFRY